jgi:signal peptidase I
MNSENTIPEPLPNTNIPKPESKKSGFWDLVKFAIIALLVVIPIRTFIAQPFIVSGSSMVPTFQNGQYLIVDEISYRLHEPKRGDVIVFKYPKDTSLYFIKRIIGVPGENVHIEGSTITIKNKENPEGFVLDESYVKNRSENKIDITLGANEYYVMGDNRSASSDSRVWGTLPRDLIVGRAYLRLFPLNTIGFLPGEHWNY